MQTEMRAAGAVLFRKGDPADHLYIVLHGRVRLSEIGKVMSDGEVFGEVGLLSEDLRLTGTTAAHAGGR